MSIVGEIWEDKYDAMVAEKDAQIAKLEDRIEKLEAVVETVHGDNGLGLEGVCDMVLYAIAGDMLNERDWDYVKLERLAEQARTEFRDALKNAEVTW